MDLEFKTTFLKILFKSKIKKMIRNFPLSQVMRFSISSIQLIFWDEHNNGFGSKLEKK